MSDTQANEYKSFPVAQGTSGATWAQLFYTFNCNAGANTVSVSGDTNSAIAIYEFSILTEIDQHSENGGTGNSQTSNSVTTTQAAELLFGYMMGNGNVGFSQTTVTGEGGSWTTGEFSNTSFLTQYQITSSAGTFASTSTTTVGKSGNNEWAAGIATFSATNKIKTIESSVAFQNLQGQVIASGLLVFSLNVPGNPAVVKSGTPGVIVPTTALVRLGNDGKIPANTVLYANDQLSPSGLTYDVYVHSSSGTLLFNVNRLPVTGMSPIDISMLTKG